ncbi:MAG: tetratricopeptide repeat protein [Phycisphaeraceae bacterium]|nr:tetratricopeptide repeat protein [Phycisphaeraceae bacterium]
MSKMRANMRFVIAVVLSGLWLNTATGAGLANQRKRGLNVVSIDQVLRLPDDQIDIGTAALIISEEWSDVVNGLRYREDLDDMAREILSRLKQRRLRPNFRAIPIINQYLFEELGYGTVANADNPDDLFLHTVMNNRKGYCLSLSILYLSLAERIGLPLHGVVVPGHFFVRYDSRTQRFNIETTANGATPDDDYYREQHAVPDQTDDGIYMTNLSKLQTLGCLFNNFGVVYMDTGQYDKALIALDRAVRINPSLSEARANMGNIYLQQGMNDLAIEQFNAALRVNPLDPKTHFNLGGALLEARQYTRAETHLKETLALDPNFGDAYAQLGRVYAAQTRFRRAELILIEGHQKFPNNLNIISQLGSVYLDTGLHTRALSQYKQVLIEQPSNLHALFGSAMCYSKLKRVDQEIAAYKRLLQYEPDSFPARVNLGHAYFGQQAFSQALVNYQKAVSIQNDDPYLYLNMGIACTELKDEDSAITYLLRSVTLKPDLGNAHYALAVTYYNQRQFKLAFNHMNLAKDSGIEVPQDQLEAISSQIN